MAGRDWTPAELGWIASHPEGSWHDFQRAGYDRSFHAFRLKKARHEHPAPTPVISDKKEESFHWTDLVELDKKMSEVQDSLSSSQDFAQIHLPATTPQAVTFISDWHAGSWGTSLQTIYDKTMQIIENDLWVACLGDMLQMAIRMRGILEISDNKYSPRTQMKFLESWLQDIEPRLLWATWDNHSVIREEEAVGFSTYAELFKEKTIYHSGIGHLDLTVGDETYKFCTSHKFRGNTGSNPTGGQQRYMLNEGLDREIAVAGDSHRPGLAVYTNGPTRRYAINTGTLQLESGYARRFFSLYSHPAEPVLMLYPSEHRIVPFFSMEDYFAVKGGI